MTFDAKCDLVRHSWQWLYESLEGGNAEEFLDFLAEKEFPKSQVWVVTWSLNKKLGLSATLLFRDGPPPDEGDLWTFAQKLAWLFGQPFQVEVLHSESVTDLGREEVQA